jgi:hypothetical protein
MVEYTLNNCPIFWDHLKKPLIKGWPKVGRKASIDLCDKFPDANIGVIDGEKVTRIDIDDSALIDGAIEGFGDTPIKVETPSGGLHLWFLANGERWMICLDGEKIDVFGRGGFGNSPPSINPNGGVYKFLEGTLADVPRLPTIRADALPREVREDTPSTVSVGWRNKALFTQCMRDLADGWETDLIPARAMVWNEQMTEPLPEAEAMKVAASAIQCHVDGKNWIGGSGVLRLPKTDFEVFAGNSDAFYLSAVLKFSHGNRQEPFAISPPAMQRGRVIPEWEKTRYQSARNQLEKLKLIKLFHQGTGFGNPNLYFLTDKVSAKETQYKGTPSPGLPPLNGPPLKLEFGAV